MNPWIFIATLSCIFLSTACFPAVNSPDPVKEIDLSVAVIVAYPGDKSSPGLFVAEVLADEVKKRTGIEWKIVGECPSAGPAVVLKSGAKEMSREGFRISTDLSKNMICIEGSGKRGLLYGIGRFLRTMNWSRGHASIPSALNVTDQPAYSIRGHQLGYRNTNNTCDAWDERLYEQYIRDLVMFGANSIEGIPSKEKQNVLMKKNVTEMNAEISRICDKYDVDFWIWITASIDLKDNAKRNELINEMEGYFKAFPRLDAIFLAGGDPGENHPAEVMRYLEELSRILRKYHPEAGVWVSLQGFNKGKTDWFFDYMGKSKPEWLTGIVHGPQSPSLAETRARLSRKYPIRLYPDVAHSVLCQFPVAWWDPAFALTEGREFVNPRPEFYTYVHNRFAPDSAGFIGYSDGVNDDVNKITWCILSWNPGYGTRNILLDYSRFFFGHGIDKEAADAIGALERNWEGSAVLNGAIDIVWGKYQELENLVPDLKDNWRWRLHALRAVYDSYIRSKLIYETALEKEANAVLGQAAAIGSGKAMDDALAILNRPNPDPEFARLRSRIEKDCDDLFRMIGLQTSVSKYHTANFERCAVLDFLDRPLNDKFWLEDQFKRIRALGNEKERIAGLDAIRTWETPAPGSLYDITGDIAHNPHVERGEPTMLDSDDLRGPLQTFSTHLGISRLRISWLSAFWPPAMVYEGLDPELDYMVKARGSGDALLSINGKPAQPAVYNKETGGLKEYPVPRSVVESGKITLKWSRPGSEANVNWRKQSYLSEVWLVPCKRK